MRWASSVEELDDRLHGMVGDTLLSAGAATYLGAFNSTYRSQLVLDWLDGCKKANIPISEEYSLVTNMATPNQVLRWQNEGNLLLSMQGQVKTPISI